MKIGLTHSNHDTYFRILPGAGETGFSDQLVAFCVFYKLGLSLEYKYLHTPFRSPRSTFPAMPLSVAAPLFNRHLFNRIYRKLRRELHNGWSRLQFKLYPEIYDFLGFNAYLIERTGRTPAAGNLEMVDIELGDVTLERNGITTFEGLQKFVRDSVSRKITGKEKTLVTFRVTSFFSFLGQLIHSNIPDYQDGLDLRKAYFEARQRRPWKSKFEDGNVKMVMHIRQGDVAVIETPWNTFIPVWSEALVEYNKFSDIQYDNRLFRVDDYCQFVKRLMSHFKDAKFSLLFFSDGFGRAFSRFTHERVKSLNLTKDQLKILTRSEKSYDQKAFNKLTNLRGSTLVVGEHPRKLCELVHSVLIADIVIIGPRGGMVPKLMATYCNVDNMPIVIVLHRGTTPPFSHTDYMGLHARARKFIYVNVVNCDYELVASKLSEMVANLHPKQPHSQGS